MWYLCPSHDVFFFDGKESRSAGRVLQDERYCYIQWIMHGEEWKGQDDIVRIR